MFSHMKHPHSGTAASASMDNMQHGRAQQGAFAAQKRLQMARSLGGQAVAPAPQPAPQPSQGGSTFRHHVATAAGMPVSHADVDGAIDDLTAAGHFSPLQNAALKHHKGPLIGDAGKATVHKIAHAVRSRKAAPVANGGMPAGMGQ
jgi:hypothetical protein